MADRGGRQLLDHAAEIPEQPRQALAQRPVAVVELDHRREERALA